MNSPRIARVILYVRDIPKIAAFYERFFDMRPLPGATDGWLELASPSGGCTIALHKASVAQKSGAAMKIVFGVEDVSAFRRRKDGFQFSNAKDPAGNSIQISSRGLKGGK